MSLQGIDKEIQGILDAARESREKNASASLPTQKPSGTIDTPGAQFAQLLRKTAADLRAQSNAPKPVSVEDVLNILK